uniref:Putative secreted peptide n=1 Tax=Anopheles braziliensis TaxID=58242 RepID=A0A2M3ZTZ1_9DIPT
MPLLLALFSLASASISPMILLTLAFASIQTFLHSYASRVGGPRQFNSNAISLHFFFTSRLPVPSPQIPRASSTSFFMSSTSRSNCVELVFLIDAILKTTNVQREAKCPAR